MQNKNKTQPANHSLVAMVTSSLVSSPPVNGVASLPNSRNKLTLQGVFAYWKPLQKCKSLLKKTDEDQPANRCTHLEKQS